MNSKSADFSKRVSFLLLSKDGDSVKQVFIASYDPQGKQINFLSLPIEVPIVVRLGEEFSLKQLCERNFEQCFWESAVLSGTTLEGYLSFAQGTIDKDSVLETRKKLFSPSFFLNLFSTKSWLDENLKTNLSSKKLYDLAAKLKGTTTDNIYFLDLNDTLVEDKLDEEKLSSQTKDLFLDSSIANEASSVKIVNGTNVSGLGSNFKRIVDNLGGRVLSVTSAKSEKTQVRLHSDKKELAERLAAFLNVELARSSEGFEADIEVVLGSDLLENIGLR